MVKMTAAIFLLITTTTTHAQSSWSAEAHQYKHAYTHFFTTLVTTHKRSVSKAVCLHITGGIVIHNRMMWRIGVKKIPSVAILGQVHTMHSLLRLCNSFLFFFTFLFFFFFSYYFCQIPPSSLV